jgi:hypothetical protein
MGADGEGFRLGGLRTEGSERERIITVGMDP